VNQSVLAVLLGAVGGACLDLQCVAVLTSWGSQSSSGVLGIRLLNDGSFCPLCMCRLGVWRMEAQGCGSSDGNV